MPVDRILTTEVHVTDVKSYEQGQIIHLSPRLFLATQAFTLNDNKPFTIVGDATQDRPNWATRLRPYPHSETIPASSAVPALCPPCTG